MNPKAPALKSTGAAANAQLPPPPPPAEGNRINAIKLKIELGNSDVVPPPAAGKRESLPLISSLNAAIWSSGFIQSVP